ncbi:MAG: hypothetical protein AAGD34_19145, partial [Pseudomonadota bacterium]
AVAPGRSWSGKTSDAAAKKKRIIPYPPAPLALALIYGTPSAKAQAHSLRLDAWTTHRCVTPREHGCEARQGTIAAGTSRSASLAPSKCAKGPEKGVKPAEIR